MEAILLKQGVTVGGAAQSFVRSTTCKGRSNGMNTALRGFCIRTPARRVPPWSGHRARRGNDVPLASSETGASTPAAVAAEGDQPEDEEDRRNCDAILNVLEALRTKRDMTFTEVKLTMLIEDPRIAERRARLGIEADSGVSREEVAVALEEVYSGRIPQDRLALQELTREMLTWPNLEDDVAPAKTVTPIKSKYASVTETGADPSKLKERLQWDAPTPEVAPEQGLDLGEKLPPWVGYGALYGVSAIPVLIVVAVVTILFLNSLQ